MKEEKEKLQDTLKKINLESGKNFMVKVCEMCKNSFFTYLEENINKCDKCNSKN